MTSTILESSSAAREAAADGDGRDRKREHIELSLDRRIQLDARFFDRWTFEHDALPDVDLERVDLSCRFLGKELRSPILISCMTGGTGDAIAINRNLALAAETAGVALGVGSQRKAIERPDTEATFAVRDLAPTAPLLGNLGAVQLNYGFGLEECRRAVEMIGADALALHLNPLQEALQPEGQGRFSGLLPKIGALVEQLGVPVVVKEIGCGLGQRTATALYGVGVRYFDSAGLGGTSWARIEASRADDVSLGELFADWGVPTPDSIRVLAGLGPDVQVIGSGGVRNGLDAAKAIALGADLVGLAQPFLRPALESAEAVERRIRRLETELRIAMFCAGARNLEALRRTPLIAKPTV
ncbi:MAG: type 2 isopentenyl-diphosphate Delta-isomerase [Holophagales bacterium]|nr:type 2 isopentenyl-diphosphate Delta-isomerase [Holophagales bacterium]